MKEGFTFLCLCVYLINKVFSKPIWQKCYYLFTALLKIKGAFTRQQDLNKSSLSKYRFSTQPVGRSDFIKTLGQRRENNWLIEGSLNFTFKYGSFVSFSSSLSLFFSIHIQSFWSNAPARSFLHKKKKERRRIFFFIHAQFMLSIVQSCGELERL